jgi:V8-like Glu-specific endopeptidase
VSTSSLVLHSFAISVVYQSAGDVPSETAGYVETVTALLAAGADPWSSDEVRERIDNCKSFPYSRIIHVQTGRTALHWAASRNRIKAVEVLIDGGADARQVNKVRHCRNVLSL